MSANMYRVKIVAPYNKDANRYIQARTFLTWKDSIASAVTNYSVRCYFQNDGLVVEAIGENNYNKLLELNNAQPYVI